LSPKILRRVGSRIDNTLRWQQPKTGRKPIFASSNPESNGDSSVRKDIVLPKTGTQPFLEMAYPSLENQLCSYECFKEIIAGLRVMANHLKQRYSIFAEFYKYKNRPTLHAKSWAGFATGSPRISPSSLMEILQ